MAPDALRPNQSLLVRELAQARGLPTPEFVVDKILKGGMGVCARIRSASDGSVYALKVIAGDLIPDEDAWARWRRELRVWLQLSAHSGVVPAYCVCWVNDLPCIAAKWMDGGNLRACLPDRSPALFYRAAIRVARTLEWVHLKHAVIHRDLKPENLLLDAERRVYVSDWGLARFSATHGHSSESRPEGASDHEGLVETQPGTFLGTVVYASPEQIQGKPDIDHRSDIYSLGCLLFEWESGRWPFTGRTAREIAEGHLKSDPPRLGGLLRKTAFGAESVIARCLQKQPRDRFPDYSELLDALRKAAARRGVQVIEDPLALDYELPVIGSEGIEHALGAGDGAIPQGGSEDSEYVLVEESDLAPYLREVDVLLGLRDWAKAEQILAHLYVPEAPLDLEPPATIAVDYSLCLVMQGRAKEAVPILSRFATLGGKPAAYYVNHSLALLHLGDSEQAESIATEGLSVFPDDPDLLGNLTIAQRRLKKLWEAAETARRRLTMGRDVHALEEAASVLRALATEVQERDLPAAATFFGEALLMLREARAINPRFLTARVSLADLLVDLGRHSEAKKEIAEIWSLGLGSELALVAARIFARALDLSSDFNECVDHCDLYLKNFPGDLVLQRIRARTIVDGFCIGKTRNGVRVVERTSLEFFERVVADPSIRITEDFLYLAMLREWMGDVAAAKTLVAQARAEKPVWWKPPFVLAAFEWREGHAAEAKSLLEFATALAPWEREPWRFLAKVLKSAGQDAEAERAAARAGEIASARDALSGGSAEEDLG